ncbi:MAG: fructosamine kinase family protein [Ornithinimicrobium sp.]
MGTSLPRGLPTQLLDAWHIEQAVPVSGGCIARSWRVETSTGTIFVKSHDDPPAGLFDSEAAGLTALRDTGAMRVPRVLAASPAGLVMEWIDLSGVGREQADREADFGARLAALHRHTGTAFGSVNGATTGYLGSVSIDLTPSATWAESYLQRRVRPLVQQAVQERGLDAAAVAHVEELIASPEVCGPPEPPTLVHGDLWSGNRLIDADGRSWLIDPSAHYGHRESDLAMMRLFGGFGEEVFAAYHEALPLAPGWDDRVLLHQVVPLAVHVILFGSSYEPALMRALRSLL